VTFELGVNYWLRRSAMYVHASPRPQYLATEEEQAAYYGSSIPEGPSSVIPKVLDVTADEYYREPAAQFARLYARWLSRGSR
jgi:hypothetical protein